MKRQKHILNNLPELCAFVFEDDSFLKHDTAKCIEMLRFLSSKLMTKWKDSGFKDYSIYSSRAYGCESLLGYWFCTKNSVGNTAKFLADKKYDTLIDDYNGVGITTAFLKFKGVNVTHFFNTEERQYETCKRLFSYLNYEMPQRVEKRDAKYDAFLSFEIAEHYEEPMKYFEEVVEATNKYLFLSTGFKNVYTGHFENYILNGEQVTRRKVSRACNMFIKENFDLVKLCYNAKPRIYQRRDA